MSLAWIDDDLALDAYLVMKLLFIICIYHAHGAHNAHKNGRHFEFQMDKHEFKMN